MKTIKVSCPAKINLTLEIVNKREDGFHNIKSIMQTISLYDYLHINALDAAEIKINLNGNNNEIPYNEKNLVYKAANEFLIESGIKAHLDIYIEKNIPVSAGLAGGSTDAAGTIFGLNEIFNKPLSKTQMHKLCAKLGSDLNVCLEGGTILATSRGEVIEKIKTNLNYPITLVKPRYLGISAGEAYTKYAAKSFKPKLNRTESMLRALKKNEDIKPFLYNDLEYAVFDDYKELQEIKQNIPNAIMSGSGSTFFVLENLNVNLPNTDYEIIKDLKFTSQGVNCNNFVIN